MDVLDIIIVGAGPIGLACALEAEKKSLKYVIIEKGTIVNSLYRYPLYMRFFSTAERLEIDQIPFVCTAPKPGRQEALEYYQSIAIKRNLNLRLYEKVLQIRKEDDIFQVATSKGNYTSKHVIIATGFYDIPNLMNIPGEDSEKVHHYYTEPYPYANQKVVVIGGSNSAVDAALETYRKGAHVTMIIRGKGISDSVKYWVKPDIENRIKEGSIQAYFESEPLAIEKDVIQFRDKNGDVQKVAYDFILALTGYLPDFQFLESSGVLLQGNLKIPVYDPQTMETNVKGLYLAGVVCGGVNTHQWFIENSRVHAQMILEHISQ